jgi:hypothetical protein
MSLAVSWAEMNQREEVSVTFQGAKAGGLVRRLFGTDGLDAHRHRRVPALHGRARPAR